MALLTENIFVWLTAAFLLAVFGWVSLFSLQKRKIGCSLIFIGILVLFTGIYSVYFFKTDRKDVRDTVYKLAAAVGDNNLDEVLKYVDPKARETCEKARVHMNLAVIDWAKVRDFKIDNINFFTSPPTAHVRFDGSVSGKVKQFGSPFLIKVHFSDVELFKDSDGKWYVTDRCTFSYPGYNGH